MTQLHRRRPRSSARRRARRPSARSGSSCSRPSWAGGGPRVRPEVLAQRAGGPPQASAPRPTSVDRDLPSSVRHVMRSPNAGRASSRRPVGRPRAIGAWMALSSRRGFSRCRAAARPARRPALDPPSSLVLMFTGPSCLLLSVIGSRARAITDRRFGELRWLSASSSTCCAACRRSSVRPEPRAGRHAARYQRPATGDDDGRAPVGVPDGTRARLGRRGRHGARRGADRSAADGRRDPLRPRARRPVHHARVLPAASPARRSLPLAGPPGGRPRPRCSRSSTSRCREPPGFRRRAAVVAARAPWPSRRAGAHPLRGRERPLSGRGSAALESLTLDIPGRRRVVIVGATGAGKTTLAPAPHAVRRAGRRDRSSWTGRRSPRSIRRRGGRVGWVPQAPHLFHGTIADNLRIARPDATDAQLRDALEAAQALDLVDELPDGSTPRSARAACAQRRRAAADRDRRVPSCATRRSSSSMSRPRISTRRWRRSSRRASRGAGRHADGDRRLAPAAAGEDARPRRVLHEGRLVEAGAPGALLASGGAFATLRDAETREPAA